MSEGRVCPKCGAVLTGTEKWCTNCGAEIPVRRLEPDPYDPRREEYTRPVPPVITNTVPEDYKPISAFGYVGFSILFAIPLVGFILQLVFSFGGTKNKNLRNYARSYLIWLLISLIIIIILTTLGITSGFFHEIYALITTLTGTYQ